MKNITIAGTLGRDAELRATPQGQKVTSFSVAVDDGWGDSKTTIWFRCSWWGVRGEKVAQYLTKGGKVTVTGELSTDEYNGKTGLTVNVSDLTLQGGGQQQESSGGGNQGGGYGGVDQGGGGGVGMEEIPFACEWRI